jgi:hypothetical protein
MRCRDIYWALREATIVTAEREGFQIVHMSIQRDHLHLLVEADHKAALLKGSAGSRSLQRDRYAELCHVGFGHDGDRSVHCILSVTQDPCCLLGAGVLDRRPGRPMEPRASDLVVGQAGCTCGENGGNEVAAGATGSAAELPVTRKAAARREMYRSFRRAGPRGAREDQGARRSARSWLRDQLPVATRRWSCNADPSGDRHAVRGHCEARRCR